MPWPAGLRAFRHRDFRLFWSGQPVSLVGTWMQSVGQAWVVLELTGSAFKLGMISALQFGPMLFLSLLAGALADRVRKRRLLLLTQGALMLQALALAALDWTGQIQYWHVAVLAAVYGVANTLDLPARQSFVVEHVGARGFGLLMASLGVGAIAGAIALAAMARTRPPLALIVSAALVTSAGVLGLSVVRHFWMAAAVLAGAGFTQIVFMASCNTTIQGTAPDHLRGRVMSLYALVFVGVHPFGALFTGGVAEKWGVGASCLWGGGTGLVLVSALALVWRRRV